MIQTSEAYKEAIVGSPRYMELLAVVDISDPDMSWGTVTGAAQAPWSKPAQLHDKDFEPPERYATLEEDRWLLDGSFDLFPANYNPIARLGYVGNELSSSSGAFSKPQIADQPVLNVAILQAASIFFSTDPLDGIPVDFTVDVMVNGVSFHTAAFTGNTETEVAIEGFTVYTPDAVRVTVTKWSLPSRRVRIEEIVAGLYERWRGDDLDSFTVTQQGQFSCLSLPYGSARIGLDNQSRRFEPRKKGGLFQSIEERQPIELYLGPRTPAGAALMPLGIFYQAGDGWKTGDNTIIMNWYLVDIIGLVSGRTYLPPDTLPTTLGGWLASIVGQLGDNFKDRWHADPNYTNKSLTAQKREDVTGKKCGDMIRWVCQATGTWPRADAKTGDLTAEPLWNQGNKYELDNLDAYPTMKANRSLAALIFQLADGSSTQYVVSGNSTSSEDTVTIINPFLHTAAQALEAARLILSQYGGNLLELTGRGDPSTEIGDVATVWLDESSATAARVMSQTLQFQDGVVQACKTSLLQADGSYLYTEFAIMDQDNGTFTNNTGQTEFRLVLSDGGQGGSKGGDGWVGRTGNLGTGFGSGYGENGLNGKGGKVWYGTIHINIGETVAYHRGAGGAPSSVVGTPGAAGQHSTFGVYSSANGTLYEGGYTDIANGQTFCRTGVPVPLPGSGDGGKGGDGGDPGEGYLKTETYTPSGADPSVVNTRIVLVVTKEPGPGKPGVAGASGFIMLTWAKPGA